MIAKEIPFDNSAVQVKFEEPEGYTIGFGFATLNPGEGSLFIDLLHVESRYRRHGLGSDILGALVNWGRRQGARFLTGDFQPETGEEQKARAFYARMGINITSDNKLHLELAPIPIRYDE